MEMIESDLRLAVPELFDDKVDLLTDGLAIVDSALRHYMDELKLSMASNKDIVECVQRAASTLLQDFGKTSAMADQVRSSFMNLEKQTRYDLKRLENNLLELSFIERAEEAVLLYNACCEPQNNDVDVVVEAQHLHQLRVNLNRLAELVTVGDNSQTEAAESVRAYSDCFIRDRLLSRTLFDCIKFSKQTITLTKKKLPLISQFNDAIAVLDVADIDKAIIPLSDQMYTEFFNPVANGTFTEIRRTDSDRVIVIKLRRPTTTSMSPDLDVVHRLRVISSLIAVLYDDVCQRCPLTMAHIARHLWPFLSRDIVDRIVSPSLPVQYLDLERFASALTSAVDDFHYSLRACHFIHEFDCTPLDDFIEQIQAKFCSNLSIQFLSKARNVVMDDSFPMWSVESHLSTDQIPERSARFCSRVTSEFVSDNPGIGFTANAVDCALLIHALLDQQGCISDVVICHFDQTARDILFMFMSIRPLYHEHAFKSAPVLPFLFGNDCLFLAHHVARCVVMYVRETFIDMVSDLADYGRQVICAQYQSLKESAEKMFTRLDGFANISQKKDYDAIILCLTAQVREWNTLRSVLSSTLPEDSTQQILLHLLSTVMEPMVQCILCRSDIPLESANRTFAALSILSDFVSEFHFPESSELCSRFEAVWKRFQVLQGILHPDQSLNCLLIDCDAGKLDVFTHKEIRSLISALFEPSRKRQSLIELRDRRSHSK
uniref:Uncharacterized protein n=1 Tax=Spongospora subterranea TaxID=70186 RepID=A0A0H5RP44_9EUKA|eukprot:CRZ10499.1 hypothetical protein [Spongospora subterranea]